MNRIANKTKEFVKNILKQKGLQRQYINVFTDYAEIEGNFLRMNDGGLVYSFDVDGVYDEPMMPYQLISEIDTYLTHFRDVQDTFKEKGYDVVIQLIKSVRGDYNQETHSTDNDNVFENLYNDKLNYLNKYVGVAHEQLSIVVRVTSEEQNENTDISDIGKKLFTTLLKDDLDYGRSCSVECEKLIKMTVAGSKLSLKRIPPEVILKKVQNKIVPSESLIPNHDFYENRFYFHGNVSEIERTGTLLHTDTRDVSVKSSVFYLDPGYDVRMMTGLRDFIHALPTLDFDIVLTLSDFESSTPLDMKIRHFNLSDKDIDDEKLRISPDNPLVNTSLVVVAYGIEEEFHKRIRDNSLNSMMAKILPDQACPKYQFASSLDGNCTSFDNNKIERCRRLPLFRMRGILPIYEAPSHYKEGGMTMSRYGSVALLEEHFKGQGLGHIAVCATSGSGKSTTINDLICEFQREHPNGIIRVLDYRTSYEKLAEDSGGRVVKVAELLNSEEGFSLFNIKQRREEDINSMASNIITAIETYSKDYREHILDMQIISTALKIAYTSSRNSEYCLKWDDVVRVMPHVKEELLNHQVGEQSLDERIQTINTLGSIFKIGNLRSIYNVDAKITEASSRQFEVYDLMGSGDEKRMLVSYYVAFLRINRDFAMVDESVPKLFIIDETNVLIGKSNDKDSRLARAAARFAVDCGETGRKSNLKFIISFPSFELLTSKAGRTLWELCPIKKFLEMKDMFESFKAHYQDTYNPAMLQNIESLVKEESLYRTAVFTIDKRDGNDVKMYSSFSYLSPLSEAYFTTTPNDLAFYKREKLDSGAREAIKKLHEQILKRRNTRLLEAGVSQ
ncbi:helicase HerA domain-containing protein [Halobacteriovorax sp. CON-3]|uniref:helicase HerA domain-containing protein n=1 Tax=Halobacteriovorax sp. CON-3 TaxID=3157710 RepID=UPI0037205401